MSAVVLREAAALMRERAEHSAEALVGPQAWKPAVGLAVASWLKDCADRRDLTSDARIEHDPEEQEWYLPALAVANAYLTTPDPPSPAPPSDPR